MSYNKIICLLSAFALCALVDAQDSLRVKEWPTLQIFGEAKTTSYRRNANDSIDQALFFDENLAQRLVRKGLANVQLYGPPGSIASSRVNGAGANHTTVNWNGIPINSPSLGQADFSLVPLSLFETAELVSNGSQAAAIGCNLGGAVVLSNQSLDWKERTELTVKSSFNSMLNFSNLIRFSYSNKRFRSQTSWIHEDLKNEFTYTDDFTFDKLRVVQDHNDSRVQGFVQSLGVKFPKTNSQLTAALWLQMRHSELPAIMGKLSPSYQSLMDSSMRATLIWSGEWHRTRWKIQAARLNEAERYTDKANGEAADYLVDSKYYNRQWVVGGDLKWALGRSASLVVGAQYFDIAALNTAYANGKAYQQYVSPFLILKKSFRGHELELSARQEIRESVKTTPASGLHYSKVYTINRNWKWTSAAELQHKYRFPTMNERYWVPGGSSTLNPEQGWTFAVNPSTEWWRKNRVFIAVNAEASYSRIDNWIQWVPKGALWAPTNFKVVELANAKTHVEVNFYGRKTKWVNALDYTFSRAMGVNQSTWDKQKAFVMPYVPLHAVSFSATCKIGKWLFGTNYRVLSKRYTLEDNSERKSLPMLALADAQIAWSILIKGAECSVVGRVENLFNVNYQMVRSYAMPGRVFTVSFQCTIKSNNNKLNEKN